MRNGVILITVYLPANVVNLSTPSVACSHPASCVYVATPSGQILSSRSTRSYRIHQLVQAISPSSVNTTTSPNNTCIGYVTKKYTFNSPHSFTLKNTCAPFK